MIFAILGVIILIASFVIALYSLIKEQNQFGDLEDAQETEKPKIIESVERELEVVKRPDVVVSPRPKETFIWDDRLPSESEQVSKIDEEKEIKEIEAKLSQIKSEASQGLDVNRQEAQSEQVLPKGNLSGEFTIREMLKKNKSLT